MLYVRAADPDPRAAPYAARVSMRAAADEPARRVDDRRTAAVLYVVCTCRSKAQSDWHKEKSNVGKFANLAQWS